MPKMRAVQVSAAGGELELVEREIRQPGYGEALVRAGDAAAAITQFQASLARTPRRAASLLGLARAAKAAGKSGEAAKAAKEFLSAWHIADAGRPEIAEARTLAKP